MKAICSHEIGIENVTLQDIEKPVVQPDHVLVKVSTSAINHGDIHWLRGEIARGLYTESSLGVAGASGCGEVIEVGENVPDDYLGNKVAYYRSLNPSQYKVGSWSEFALMHYLDCIILPEDTNLLDYCGSVVNIMVAYAFYKHAALSPGKGVIATAGESLTGKAILGIAQEKDIPIISIVRDDAEKQRLEPFGAKNILVQSDGDFEEKLESLSEELNTTEVFDGVGGPLLSRILPLLPFGSTTHSYGFLAYYTGEDDLLTNTMVIFQKNLKVTGFAVMRNETTLNQENLRSAMNDLRAFVDKPHFRIEAGKIFRPEEFKEAIDFAADPKNKDKAVFKF